MTSDFPARKAGRTKPKAERSDALGPLSASASALKECESGMNRFVVPLQGTNLFWRSTQGVASLALGFILAAFQAAQI